MSQKNLNLDLNLNFWIFGKWILNFKKVEVFSENKSVFLRSSLGYDLKLQFFFKNYNYIAKKVKFNNPVFGIDDFADETVSIFLIWKAQLYAVAHFGVSFMI